MSNEHPNDCNDTPDMCLDCRCPNDPDPDDDIRLYGSMAAPDRIGEPSLRRAA